MGRRSSETAGKYTALVQARVTPKQLEQIQQMADAEGLEVSSWIRRMLIREINEAFYGIQGWLGPGEDPEAPGKKVM